MTPETGLFAWLAKVNVPLWAAVPVVVVWAIKDHIREWLSFFFLDAATRAAREDNQRAREEGVITAMVRQYLKKNAALLRENGGLITELKLVRDLLTKSLDRETACAVRCNELEARIKALEAKEAA